MASDSPRSDNPFGKATRPKAKKPKATKPKATPTTPVVTDTPKAIPAWSKEGQEAIKKETGGKGPTYADDKFNQPTQPDAIKPTKPQKVEVPVIEPPKIDPSAGKMEGVGDVKVDPVVPSEKLEAQQAQAAEIKAQTGTGTSAKAPKDVAAAGYDATQVDPLAAQAEAAQTDYKAKVDAAVGTTPEDAMVQNQMEELTKGLESGNIPLWAQGAVSAVDAQLAARGMSRSSIGQADLTNAIMQAALPMAQQNASTVQQTNLQNLQNEQTANNLQAQLQTNVELANLSNRQQTVLANQASKQAIMLSNQSADNASKQFNAQSQNQVNTFMANLKSQTEQFNVAQANAMEQFNVSQVNAASTANAQLQSDTSKFNSAQANGMAQFNQQLATDLKKFDSSQSLKADMFNKQNQMVIAQSNAEWRRKVATVDTQMQHEANMQNAQNQFSANQTEMANHWQTMRDQASWAWQSQENALNRETQLIVNSTNNAAAKDAAKLQADAAKEAGYADAIGALVGATVGGLLD